MNEINNRLKRLEKGKRSEIRLIAKNAFGTEKVISILDAIAGFENAIRRNAVYNVYHPEKDRTPNFSIIDAIDWSDSEEERQRIDNAIRESEISPLFHPLTDKPLSMLLTPVESEKARRLTVEYDVITSDHQPVDYKTGNLYDAIVSLLKGKTGIITTTNDFFDNMEEVN